ncbi:MAG: hypothetical protein KQJ78_12625 [Deltaproteobacteria bacterium]|nr:hypothetical protein [Deltaproteobacteria bacterium]
MQTLYRWVALLALGGLVCLPLGAALAGEAPASDEAADNPPKTTSKEAPPDNTAVLSSYATLLGQASACKCSGESAAAGRVRAWLNSAFAGASQEAARQQLAGEMRAAAQAQRVDRGARSCANVCQELRTTTWP